MSAKLLYFITSLVVIGSGDQMENFKQKMIDSKIVPEMIETVPPNLCKVVYKYGEVHPGSVWSDNNTWDIPNVTWPTEPDSYYCLYFGLLTTYDPKYSSHPTTKNSLGAVDYPIVIWPLWIITNILGTNIKKGKAVIDYVSPSPPLAGVNERYVFLIYKQPTNNLIIEKEPWKMKHDITPLYNEDRPIVDNLTKFEIMYNLGKPIAGNFFTIEPLLDGQLRGIMIDPMIMKNIGRA